MAWLGHRRWTADHGLHAWRARSRTAGDFVRVSRADLVNVTFVERIRSNGDGSATLILKDGTEVRVARRRESEVKKALEG